MVSPLEVAVRVMSPEPRLLRHPNAHLSAQCGDGLGRLALVGLRLVADHDAGAVHGEGDGIVRRVDHGAVCIPHVDPDQLGGAAVQLERLVVFRLKGELRGFFRRAADIFRHLLAIDIADRRDGAPRPACRRSGQR